jgi:hypothetical protein
MNGYKYLDQIYEGSCFKAGLQNLVAFLSFFFSWDWGLSAKQVLYHLSHTSSSFYFIYLFIYFEMGVS